MAAAASASRASQWDTKWEVLLHYVEALLCCMYGCIVCMYGQKMRHKASWLKPVCLTHCSSTTPTKWRQQKKKKEEKIPVFLLRRAPQRGCSTYSCGTRHHFSPLWKKKRRRKKKNQCLVWIELNTLSSLLFFFGCVSLSKNQWRLNNKAQTLQCHTCALARGNVASLTPVS